LDGCGVVRPSHGASGNTGDFARNKNVSRDVVGLTLGYYYGDYRKVNTVAGDNFELKYAGNADFNLAAPSLYNGNIRHAVYAIARLNEIVGYAQPEGFSYKYDQLNRLLSQRERINYTLSSTYAWSTTPAERSHFREDVAYDPNGNIINYLRHGHKSSQYLMDSLTYHYEANTNKLNYIDDKQTGALSVYRGDLKDQAPGNYAYTGIGNLYQDTRDSISHINWSHRQKIKRITKTDRKINFAYDAMQNRVVKYSKPNASNTEKRTYYIRDAQGNVMATYEGQVQDAPGFDISWDTLRLAEHHIYGSARVGTALPNVKLYPSIPNNPHLPDTSHYPIFEGWKHYEISNHLGNILAVITDRKRGNAASGTTIQWFDADVVSAQQYYPFGMLMPDTTSTNLRRQYSNPNCFDKDYRYGFNGKEGDDDVKGDDNQQDYGMRIYDPRVGRFLSVDPIAKKYPMLTPFQFASNSPISGVDLDGLEYYFAIDGRFLGNISNSNSKYAKQVYVINDGDISRSNNNVAQIHAQILAQKIMPESVPVYNNYEFVDVMSIDQLLDLTHINFGEERGAQAYQFSHVFLNGEIKTSNRVEWYKTHNAGYKKPHTRLNSGSIEQYEDLGTVFNMNILAIGLPRSWKTTSGVLHQGKDAHEYSVSGEELPDINNNYMEFFKYKDPQNIKGLIEALPVTQKVFSENFKARLGKTIDPLPEHDSWRGDGRTNHFQIDRDDIPSGKSEKSLKYREQLKN